MDDYLTESLNRVKDAKIKKIDGETIFLMIQLLANDGIKRGEFVKLRLKDIVFNQDGVVGINIEGYGQCNLEISSRKLLGVRLKNIFGTDVNNIDLNAPVFPEYFGLSGEKKLLRHLKTLNKHLGINIDLHYVKKIGVMRYFQDCGLRGMSKEKSIEATKDKFRYQSGKQVKNIFKEFAVDTNVNTTKLSNTDEFLKEWDKLQTINFSDRKQVWEHVVKCLNFIDSLQTAKKNKTKIKKTYLRDLQKTLNQNIGKHKIKTSNQSPPKSLAEIIIG
jgi:hypothetical protein